MSPQFPRPLHYVVTILCGLLALPLALVFQDGMLSWLRGPVRTAFPMLWANTLAGFIIGCLNRTRGTTRSFFEEVPTKAGFLCSFVSASALVVYSSILHGKAGHVASDALLTLFIAVVSVLPATLCAAFFGGLGSAVRSAFFRTGRPKFQLRPIHAVYLLCFLGLLSPFVPGVFREPLPPSPPPRAPAVVAATPPPKVEPLPPRPPEPPPFKYDRPADFDTYTPERIVVVAQKHLSDVSAGRPVLFSPDGRKLAFLRTDANPVLVVMDMQSFKDIAVLRLGAFPTSLAWSPAGEKLISLFQTDDVRGVSIVFPEKSSVIRLPKPESSSLLWGALDWPDTNHAVLHRGREKALCLDLESLDFRPLEDSAFFRTLDAASKVRFENPPTTIFPKTSAWSLEIAWGLHSLRQRQIDGAQLLHFAGGPAIFACSRSKPIRRRIPGISVNMENLVLFAPDRTKVLVFNGSDATIYYLGLGESSKSIVRIATGKKIDELPNPDPLRKALAEKHLCALVSAPLTNPLNGKVVGPDNPIKGTARILSWDGSTAELLIEDAYAPIAFTDIVSTLFEWRNRFPVPFSDSKTPEWWTALGDSAGTVEYQGPARIEDSFAGQGAQLEFIQSDKLISFRAAPPKEPPQPSSLPEPGTTPQSTSPISDLTMREITSFIRRHHQKAEAGVIRDILADYAEKVEHFNKGLVDRAYIQAEEEKYHAPGYIIQERVRSQIALSALGPDRVLAGYQLQFLRAASDGAWTKGAADVTLEIAITPQGFQIVKQNSVPRDAERQKGRGNIPSLKQ